MFKSIPWLFATVGHGPSKDRHFVGLRCDLLAEDGGRADARVVTPRDSEPRPDLDQPRSERNQRFDEQQRSLIL